MLEANLERVGGVACQSSESSLHVGRVRGRNKEEEEGDKITYFIEWL